MRCGISAAALSARADALRARVEGLTRKLRGRSFGGRPARVGATRAEGAFRWRQHGTPVTVTAVRVRMRDPGGGFDSRAAARASLAGPPPALSPIFAAAVIEAAFRLRPPTRAAPWR